MMKIGVLALYALMMVAVIVLTARKKLSLNEFLLGGRNVGPWLSALSYGASYFSAVIIVGYAGSTGWTGGLSAVWCGIGNALVGSLLAWKLLARPTRRMGEKLGTATIPGFFEKRYRSRGLRLLASLIIFVFLLPYSASVYKGLGGMFQRAFGFDYAWCVTAIALLSAVYLFAGGYRATAVTDFIQGFIMLAGIAAVVVYIVRAAGGVGEGVEALARRGRGVAPAAGGQGVVAAKQRAAHLHGRFGHATDDPQVLRHPRRGKREAGDGDLHRLCADRGGRRVFRGQLRPRGAGQDRRAGRRGHAV